MNRCSARSAGNPSFLCERTDGHGGRHWYKTKKKNKTIARFEWGKFIRRHFQKREVKNLCTNWDHGVTEKTQAQCNNRYDSIFIGWLNGFGFKTNWQDVAKEMEMHLK